MTRYTINDAREAIYSAFVTGWADAAPYTFENENFDPPAGAAWVRLSVRHRAAVTDTLGVTSKRKVLRIGGAVLQIFTPRDQGMQEADELAETFRSIFEGKTITPATLWFTTVSTREAGPDGEWLMLVCDASFTYNDEI